MLIFTPERYDPCLLGLGAADCVTVVAKPEHHGMASGFACMPVKLPSFVAVLLFPPLFTAIGKASATLFVATFPFAGLLAAIFILREVCGYGHG